MSDGVRVEITLPSEAIEEIVDEVTRRVLAALPDPPPPSPYMTIKEAMEYLRCERHRIDGLLGQRKLTTMKDGGTRDNPRSGRTLLLRAEVEALPWRAP